MTTRPHITPEGNWLAGVGALALFAVLAVVFLTAGIPAPEGFPDASIIESIGYAMFNLDREIPSEGFLVAFETVDVVLIAALAGAVMLARRSEDEEVAADGGQPPSVDDDEGGDA